MGDKKDPAFLFYPADFLIGTMDMSNEEIGIYIRLLCRQHQKGNINPKLMNDLSEEILSKFCRDSQGNYYNKRLKAEIDKRNKYAESRRTNRLNTSQKREHMLNTCKTYDHTYDDTYVKHMENENININKDLDLKDLNKVGVLTKEILSELNSTCGTSYKATSKKTQSLVRARVNEGFNVDDFKTVIKKKYKEWHGTEYEKFLRPETLFGTKFEGYLNQREGGGKNKEADKLNDFYNMADKWADGD